MKKNGVWKGASLLLASALVLMSACTNSGSKSPSSSPSGSPGTEPPLRLSIQLESWGSAPKGGPALEFIEQQTNTKLDVTWIPYSEYETRFNTQLASGQLPDIVATVRPSGQLFSSQVIKAINAGVFHDLTPYIKAPDFAEKYPNLAKYSQIVWDSIEFNGKIYAMPRYTDPIAGNSGIWIREDLLKDAGLPEPTTVEELADTLIALSQKYGIYGLETPSKDLDRPNYKPLVVAFTGVNDWAVDKDGNFQYQAFMPEYKDFLLWMKKLYDAKAIDPEFALEQGGSKYSEGKSAAKIGTWWGWAEGTDDSVFSDAFKADHPEAKTIGLIPLKGPKAYTVAINPFNRPALITKKNVKEEDLPRVLQLFDYAASETHREMTMYGIEGVHHTVENGVKVVNDKFYADNIGHWYVLFNAKHRDAEEFVQESVQKGAIESDIERMREMARVADEKAVEADLQMPHWSVESPTYFEKWSTIIKDLNDNKIKVIMGQMTLEQWDQYVSGIINSADYQKILKEFKEGWLAANK